MPELASVADLLAITSRQRFTTTDKIVGITASKPKYVLVPDDDDVNAVNEFVVDVFLMEGQSQQLALGTAARGLKRIDNVLIAQEALGNVISNLNTPVEIKRSQSGQLQVVARAKIALPQLVLDTYSLKQLKLDHLAEIEDGLDGFNRPVVDESVFSGVQFTCTVSNTVRLNTFRELGNDDNGNFIGLGINPFQRVIGSVTRACEISATEVLQITEEETHG